MLFRSNTLLIGISLPVTLVLSFILLYFFDVSLKLISLGGIAMAVALTLIPLAAYLFYRVNEKKRKHDEEDRIRGLSRISVPVMDFFKNLYKRMLSGLIRRKWASLLFMVFSFGLLIFSVLRVLPLIPKEIISPPLSDRIVMFFRSSAYNDPDVIIQDVIPSIEARIEAEVGEYVDRTYADVSGRFNLYFLNLTRSEERRVGKEGRSRWSPYH